MEPMERTDAVRIWRNGRIPVVYKPEGRGLLMVRVPYAGDNREWLLGSGRLIAWIKQFRAWELPRSRFEDIVLRALARYESVYLIQAYRRLQKCAPACWEATGLDCECSCMGENHGSGVPLEHEVSETFAFEWGGRQLACRLLTKRRDLAQGGKSDGTINGLGRNQPGVRWGWRSGHSARAAEHGQGAA